MKNIMNECFLSFFILLCSMISSCNATAGAIITNFHRSDSTVTATVAAWTEPEGIPNPCYGWSSCYVGPDVDYAGHGIGGLYGSCNAGGCLAIENLKTTADVARGYKKQHLLPFTYTFHIIDFYNSTTCAGMVFIKEPSLDSHAHAEPFPGSACTTVPPDNYQCSLTIPPYIDHGVLGAESLNGNSMTVIGKIKCNYSGQMTISTISDSGDNIVHLKGDSLISTITVNEKNAKDGLILKTMKNQTVDVRIKSTLTSDGTVTSGSYKGNVLMYVNYS